MSPNMKSTPDARKTSCAASRDSAAMSPSCRGDDPLLDVGDVLPRVAVLRRRLAVVAREQAAGETVDLRAVVVEVVLAGDEAALRLEHPGEAVADRRPAHAADVDRAGRVGGDELEVDRDARRTGSPRPKASPCSTIVFARAPAAAASSRMLMKPGPATSTDATPSTAASPAAKSAASSRGFSPSGFASFMAMLAAQSPCSRLFGRSSATSASVSGAGGVAPRRSNSVVTMASNWAESWAGVTGSDSIVPPVRAPARRRSGPGDNGYR